jgi:hypothetical protein
MSEPLMIISPSDTLLSFDSWNKHKLDTKMNFKCEFTPECKCKHTEKECLIKKTEQKELDITKGINCSVIFKTIINYEEYNLQILCRNYKNNTYYWELPGGKAKNQNETVWDTIVRESQEELFNSDLDSLDYKIFMEKLKYRAKFIKLFTASKKCLSENLDNIESEKPLLEKYIIKQNVETILLCKQNQVYCQCVISISTEEKNQLDEIIKKYRVPSHLSNVDLDCRFETFGVAWVLNNYYMIEKKIISIGKDIYSVPYCIFNKSLKLSTWTMILLYLLKNCTAFGYIKDDMNEFFPFKEVNFDKMLFSSKFNHSFIYYSRSGNVCWIGEKTYVQNCNSIPCKIAFSGEIGDLTHNELIDLLVNVNNSVSNESFVGLKNNVIDIITFDEQKIEKWKQENENGILLDLAELHSFSN